jgi:hypothetical protein
VNEDAKDLDELVFHPWAVQGPRDVLTLVSGSGSHVIAVGVIGGIGIDFDSCSDRAFWFGFPHRGRRASTHRHRTRESIALGRRSSFVRAGGIPRFSRHFWLVLPPLATIALINLAVLWARRPAVGPRRAASWLRQLPRCWQGSKSGSRLSCPRIGGVW